MSFIKPKTIYESKKVKVEINQCYNNGRKTYAYAIRRDDPKGLGHYLGEIRFDGGWRQYVFIPDYPTKWCAECLEGISKFIFFNVIDTEVFVRKSVFFPNFLFNNLWSLKV